MIGSISLRFCISSSSVSATCSTHLNLLNFKIWMMSGPENPWYTSWLVCLLHIPSTNSPQNILWRIFHSNIRRSESLAFVRVQVSGSCSRTGRIRVLYRRGLVCLERMWPMSCFTRKVLASHLIVTYQF